LSKNLALRLIVAAVGIPSLILICYLNGIFLLVFSILLAGLAGFELASMFRKKGYHVNVPFSIILPVILILAAYFRLPVINILAISFFLISSIIILRYSSKADIQINELLNDFFANLLPVFYIGLLGIFIIYLGAVPDQGGRLLIYVFLIVWAADTAAYFGGKALGRHKLTISISPNKTWEGFYFAFIGALIAAIVSRLLFLEMGWLKIVVITLVACFFGQIGDLLESGLKRHCGVKDSSAILPGHGGIFDRFDSFFFAVPVVYLFNLYWH
jgi:phosphatidate cytidylyltransferase